MKTATSVLGGSAAAPQVLTSLVDGQYLQVYPNPQISNRLFPDDKKLEKLPTSTLIYVLAYIPTVQNQHSLPFKKTVVVALSP